MQAPVLKAKRAKKKKAAPMKKGVFGEDSESSCSDAEYLEEKEPVKKAGGFFGAIASMFGGSKAEAPVARGAPASMPLGAAMPSASLRAPAQKSQGSAWGSSVAQKQSRKRDDYAEALSKARKQTKF